MLDKHVKGYDIFSPIAPQPLAFNDLTSELCGQLVNLHDMQFAHNATEAEADVWSGYSIFADRDGDAIAVYTSSSASYAHKCVPTERANITGILQYGDVEGEDMYIIKMRYEKDCLPAD